MVNDVTPSVPAIGACLRCNNLFLITATSPTCLLCGAPPAVALPFPVKFTDLQDVEFERVGIAEGHERVDSVWLTCPVCATILEIAPLGSIIHSIPPPPAPPAEPAAAEPSPGPSAAVQPADTPPPPAMDQDAAGEDVRPPTSERDITHTEEPSV